MPSLHTESSQVRHFRGSTTPVLRWAKLEKVSCGLTSEVLFQQVLIIQIQIFDLLCKATTKIVETWSEIEEISLG